EWRLERHRRVQVHREPTQGAVLIGGGQRLVTSVMNCRLKPFSASNGVAAPGTSTIASTAFVSKAESQRGDAEIGEHLGVIPGDLLVHDAGVAQRDQVRPAGLHRVGRWPARPAARS
ncbi:hypothetical protein, partial [Microbacterium aurum]